MCWVGLEGRDPDFGPHTLSLISLSLSAQTRGTQVSCKLSSFYNKDIEPQIKNLWRKGTHPGLCGGLVAWPWLESTSPHSQLGVLIKFLVTNLGNIQLTRSNREAVSYGGRGGFLKLISSRHRFPMSTSFVCLFFFHYRNNTHSLKELLNLQRCRKKRENIIILPVIYTTINIWMWGFCF